MSANIIKEIKPLGFPWNTQDPFLFCVHHEDFYPAGNDRMGPQGSLEGRNIGQDFTIKDGWRMYHGSEVPGFPAHPHRGFETVTVVEKGLVDHADSLGATGRFGNGDVQWMTAGKGVMHSEMFPLRNTTEDNPFELFQIWLNLPRNKKFAEPHYTMLWHEDIPVVVSEDENGLKTQVKVVAGDYKGTKALDPTPDSWASNIDHDVAIWKITLEPGAQYSLPATKAEANRALYFFRGAGISIADQELSEHAALYVQPDQDISIVNGPEPSQILLLQGVPINEPVAKYGPFVMNEQSEIHQAMQDYQRTEFGGWPWPKHDYVHPREIGRFAQHADGIKEMKDPV